MCMKVPPHPTEHHCTKTVMRLSRWHNTTLHHHKGGGGGEKDGGGEKKLRNGQHNNDNNKIINFYNNFKEDNYNDEYISSSCFCYSNNYYAKFILFIFLLFSIMSQSQSTKTNTTDVLRRIERDNSNNNNNNERRVVCYYTNWSVYRPGTAKFSPQNINPYLCTHLIYAFGGLDRENGLRPYDKYQDIEQGGYAKFTGLKTYNKALKTMLAIGGWNEGSARFSPLVADEDRRKEFVKNVIKFLRQNHFDGLDLDWEYPAFRDGGKSKDRENYAQLVQELREEFDRESSKTGRTRLLLTMAVPAGIEYIDKGYDVPKLNRYLDFMNILSYDYHSAFEPAVNHHSPLFSLEEDNEYNFDAQLSIDYTVKHYLDSGADRDKLVLGIPTYGRSYTLFNPDSNQLGAPADGPGEQGDATREKGYLAYYEICASLKSDNEWNVEHPKRSAMGPYAFKGNQWVGYDDEDIVREKAKYVNDKNLGGIMFWSIDNDDFRGSCHDRPYPLIEAGKEALLGPSATANNKKSGNKNAQTSLSNEAKTVRPLTVSPALRRPSKPTKLKPTLNRISSTTQRASYTQNTPTISRQTTQTPQSNSLTTPEPPTTPDPGSDFVCKDEGFFPHPRDCKKYFWCLDSGPSNLGIVAHQFTCPSGLFFNKAADSCDFARNVLCKEKKESKKTTTTAAATTPATSTTSNPRLKLTAATAKSTGIRYTFTTPTTTTTTTTETPAPRTSDVEDEMVGGAEDDYDHAEEDPQAIKQLIMLIKKLGGVAELEKQLENAAGGGGGTSDITPPSTISRNLYNRVLTPTKYQSPYKNGPSGPQNEGLAHNEGEGAGGGDGSSSSSYRREKPQYVTINRERPATKAPNQYEETPSDEGRSRFTYKSLNRNKPVIEDVIEDDEQPEEEVTNVRLSAATPKYKLIDRRRPPSVEQRQRGAENEDEDVDNDTAVSGRTSSSPRYTSIQRSRSSTTQNDDPATTTTTTTASRYVTLFRQRPAEETQPIVEDTTSSSSSSPYFRKDSDQDNNSKINKVKTFRGNNNFNSNNNNNNGEDEITGHGGDKEEEREEERSTTIKIGQNNKVNRARVAVRRPINRRPVSSSTSSLTSSDENTGLQSQSGDFDSVTTKAGARTPGKFIRRRVNKHRAKDNENNNNNLSDNVFTTSQPAPFSSALSQSPFDRITPAIGSVTTPRPKKFEFPKRTGRPSTTLQQPLASSSSQKTTAISDEPTLTAGGTDSQIVESKEELAMTEDGGASTLPDLANVAVAAIQSLATQSPIPIASPIETTTFSTISTPRRTSPSPAFTILSTTAPSEKVSPVTISRGTVRPFFKKRISQQSPSSSRLSTPKPSYISKSKVSSGAYDPSADYEASDYYAAEPVDVPLSGKVRIHNDGYIECLDIGNFPHPFSCKKFISCAKMENEHLLGWEYTCPRGLSFDPIGGICNWSAGLGCKE